MVDAQITGDITTPEFSDFLGETDWLSFAYAARPLINMALGYSSTIREDLIFLNAFRTDFSSLNNADFGEYSDLNHIETTNYNIYHYSAGVKFSIKRQRFIAGGDFAFGYRLDQKQIANFSDPVEYEPVSHRALQGPLMNTMDLYYFGFSIYIGATLNFVRATDSPEK